MKIGITGSSGFIGKHLISVLEQKKGIELSFFDLPKDNLLNLSSLQKFVLNKDVIVHGAAVNRGSNIDIISSGIIGVYNLISAVRSSKKKTKIILLSSIHAEGETVFGLSKRLSEVMLEEFSQEHKTPVTIFRITNVFGPHGKPFYNSVVATFCYQIANNEKIAIHNGKKEINLIYIKDLANIISKEILKKRKNPFYFKTITTNNAISIKELSLLLKSFKKNKNQKFKSKFHKDLYNTFISYLNHE